MTAALLRSPVFWFRVVSLLVVVSLALASMTMLLIVTGAAVAAAILGDVARRFWRSTRHPVVMPRRAIG